MQVFRLCRSHAIIDQVLSPRPPAIAPSIATKVDEQPYDTKHDPLTLRQGEKTLIRLLTTLEIGPLVHSRLPLGAASMHDYTIQRTHIGSGRFSSVEAVELTIPHNGSYASAIKIPKPGQQQYVREEFQNELHLYQFLKKSLEQSNPAIEEIRHTFGISNKAILGGAIMIRGYEESHDLYPNDLVGVMPLIECDGNLGDMINKLLDVVNIETTPETSAIHVTEQSNIVHQFLTGMRDLAILLAIYDACQIVHNDIKADNIAIDRFGIGRLLDHEFSKVANDSASGYDGGTTAYAAPERLRQNCRYGTRADLFSLGRVLAEIFLGHLPTVDKTGELTKVKFDLFPEVEEATEATLGNEFIIDLKHLVYPTSANHHHALTSQDPNVRPSALTIANFLQRYCDANHLGSAFRALEPRN